MASTIGCTLFTAFRRTGGRGWGRVSVETLADRRCHGRKEKLLILRIVVLLTLIGILSTPAIPQGGCTQYQLWGVSGYAGNATTGPGGDPTWQQNLANQEATYGGAPTCTYTWTTYGDGGHWYGDCRVYAYQCSQPPPPPTAAPQENEPGSDCPNCSAGRPINLANGNTYIEQQDIKVPGIGGGLALDRIWNGIWPSSQSGMNVGLFGPNWRSTYEERVFVGSDGTVKYSRSDGSYWSFQLFGSPPIYHVIAPATESATSMTYGPTQWTLTFKNGEKRLFDPASGALTAMIDRNGNTTQLSYDAIARLATVTDPASRHLYFSYGSSSSRLITSVTSDIGLSLSYLYDANGRLIQVTKPDQTTISFQYDNNSMITAVTDSAGKILESHTYDNQLRGSTSSRANGVEAVTVTYPTQ